jgi:tetratricopeptide (TPR) repeat protein
MSGSATRAVFLSYAREDSEAARHIADALRGFGVEAWFDQNELRGGDAWDAKIRRRIKECTLFVPIISANTQKRHEGYFRLEWHLAEQRSTLMARGRPFIVPVVTDSITDAEALVPDAFLAVQWSRLPGGEVSAEFCERIRTLLKGADEIDPDAARPPASGAAPRPLSTFRQHKKPRMAVLSLAAVALVAAAVAVALLARRPSAPERPPAKETAESPPAGAAALVAKTRHIFENYNYGPEDLGLAEKFMAQASDLAPDSADVWALRGYVQATFILRTWDYSQGRLEAAQRFCNHALALDPKQTEAMLGLSIVMEHQGAYAHVQALMRGAVQLRPDDPRLYRMLGIATCDAGRTSEGIAILKENVQRFPLDPLSWYDLGRAYIFEDRLVESIDAFRHVVDLTPVTGAYLSLVRGYCLQGNLAAAEAAYAQVPFQDRSGDRAVGTAMFLALLEGKTDLVIENAGSTAADYFADAAFRGPKAFMCALAFEHAGKSALAREQWAVAVEVLRKRLANAELRKEPTDWDEWELGIALAWKGDAAGAAAIMSGVEAIEREDNDKGLAVQLARYYAGLGGAAKAVPYIRASAPFTAVSVRINPWYCKIRGAAEFNALLSSLAGTRDGKPTLQ